MDECLQHVEPANCTDAGAIEPRLPEAAPIPEHRQEDTSRILFRAERQIDLRQDFDYGSPARFDDPNVVLRMKAAVSHHEDRWPLALFVGGLRQGESHQIMLVVLMQPGERLVLADDHCA
ncbi:MAG: hypothetical protein OXU74_17150 [Gemmatimonadota bacterium]|nr:hypothetical protein [Gemmatimonadota bacterium]